MIYNFTINDFEGPLDLLLHLIKINKMDIENINLNSLTMQYLEFVDKMKNENIDIASEYLVMASELVHIKSKMLLDIDNDKEDDLYEMNNEDDLKEKLKEYDRIKNITNTFKELENTRNEVYTKIPTNLDEYKKDVELDNNITLDDLINAFNVFLEREKLKKPINTKITKKELSVGDRIKGIRNIFKSKNKVSFVELFDNYTKPYVIVTFLSILEMSKNEEIRIIQKDNFSDIVLEKK